MEIRSILDLDWVRKFTSPWSYLTSPFYEQDSWGPVPIIVAKSKLESRFRHPTQYSFHSTRLSGTSALGGPRLLPSYLLSWQRGGPGSLQWICALFTFVSIFTIIYLLIQQICIRGLYVLGTVLRQWLIVNKADKDACPLGSYILGWGWGWGWWGNSKQYTK